MSYLCLHIHKQPLLTRQLPRLAEIIQRRQAKANPTQILDQRIAARNFSVAINAHDEAIACEIVDFAEFQESHEPSLEITHNDRLIEEDEHGFLFFLLRVRYEAAEPDSADVIPHFDIVAHDAVIPHRIIGLRISDFVRAIIVVVVVDVPILIFTMRTQNQRSHTLLPLTQENRP
jgi:hypothetical protein